jgi:hypothetical protein
MLAASLANAGTSAAGKLPSLMGSSDLVVKLLGGCMLPVGCGEHKLKSLVGHGEHGWKLLPDWAAATFGER